MLVATLEAVDRSKLWCSEVVGKVLSGGSIEGVRDDCVDGSKYREG